MIYKDTSKLPASIRETLPPEAQQVYLEAYNNAWDLQPAGGHHGLSRESVAHQMAWDTVNREFVHDVKRGKWYRKGETLVEEEAVKKEGWWAKFKKLF